MTVTERNDLATLKDELRDIWLNTQKKFKSLEDRNEALSRSRRMDDIFYEYHFLQGYYAGISLAHGKLEGFLDEHK